MDTSWLFLPGLSEKQLGSYVWAPDVRLIMKTNEGAKVFLSNDAYANTALTAEEVIDLLDAAVGVGDAREDAREDRREIERKKIWRE